MLLKSFFNQTNKWVGLFLLIKLGFVIVFGFFSEIPNMFFHENANPLSKSDISFWHEGKQEIVLENSSD